MQEAKISRKLKCRGEKNWGWRNKELLSVRLVTIYCKHIRYCDTLVSFRSGYVFELLIFIMCPWIPPNCLKPRQFIKAPPVKIERKKTTSPWIYGYGWASWKFLAWRSRVVSEMQSGRKAPLHGSSPRILAGHRNTMFTPLNKKMKMWNSFSLINWVFGRVNRHFHYLIVMLL